MPASTPRSASPVTVTGLALATFLSAMLPLRLFRRGCTSSPLTRPASDTEPVVKLTFVLRSYWRSVAAMPFTVRALGVMSTSTLSSAVSL